MSWIVDERELKGLSDDAIGAVLSVGNGRFCTRGTHADAFAADSAPYPYRGTYVAGLYTRAGWGLDYPLVAPDWTAAVVTVDGRMPEVTAHRRFLDMQQALFVAERTLRAGRTIVALREERFASWARPNVGAQRLTLTLNEGPATNLTLQTGIDGDVRNSPSKVYKPGKPRNCDARGVRLSTITGLQVDGSQSHILLRADSTARHVSAFGRLCQVSGPAGTLVPSTRPGFAGLSGSFRLEPGQSIVIDKLAAIHADMPGFESATDTGPLRESLRFETWEGLLATHRHATADFWRLADVRIEGDAFAQLAVRYAAWSTRIAAGLDNGGSSIGPKNLTGDWYRGGVFWDMDLYQLPLLAAVAPERAVNHIRYRHKRLRGARQLAAQDGYDGARFPFTSFDEGVENPPTIGGTAKQQLHINIDVPWGILHTHALSGDDRMLLESGLEVLIEQCRFWLSFIGEPEADGFYHIRNLCGPDELHAGIDDNTYTNAMVAWVLRSVSDLVERLAMKYPVEVGTLTGERDAAVGGRVLFGPAERAHARDIAARIFLPRLPDGRPAQFAGFEKQPEPNAAIRNVWGAGDNTNKQADALMLVQALPRETPDAWIASVYAHDVPLCTQTSSLSPGTHVIAARRLRRRLDAERFWNLVAGMDLRDSFGNTTHGVHGAGQGGVWLAAVHGFGGLQVGVDRVALAPLLPRAWTSLSYALAYRGSRIQVQVGPTEFNVTNHGPVPVPLHVDGRDFDLPAGEKRVFAIRERWEDPALRACLLDADWALVPERAASTRRLLEALKGAGIRTALVSSGTDLADRVRATGLDATALVLADASCIRQPPPDPELILIAAARCRALPWECACLGATGGMRTAVDASGAVWIDAADAMQGVDVLRRTFSTCGNPVDPYLGLNIAKLKTELAHG